jgi:hypothetical protein
MKCPLGGKPFTHIGTATSSQWGSRPDGKPYGSWTFPMPLPVCPDNGLVVYREFTREDIRRLKPLVATPEYQAARKQDTTYYLAQWLMRQLDEPLDQRLRMLQQASWQSDLQFDRKRAYQEEYVRRASEYARPDDPKAELNWFAIQLRAANALRELKKFDEAMLWLDALPLQSLVVEIPPAQPDNGNHAERVDAAHRRDWLRYADSLRKVIARKDSSSEPIDMVPTRVAANLCVGYPTTLPEYKVVCESEGMRHQRERAAKMRELLNTPAAAPAPAPADPVTPR